MARRDEMQKWRMHGWIDKRDAVAQRMKALRFVWRNLPDEAYEVLRERLRDITWLVIDPLVYGFVWHPRAALALQRLPEKPLTEIIYLSPKLEQLSFSRAVDTVAHELAHVYHRHETGGPA